MRYEVHLAPTQDDGPSWTPASERIVWTMEGTQADRDKWQAAVDCQCNEGCCCAVQLPPVVVVPKGVQCAGAVQTYYVVEVRDIP